MFLIGKAFVKVVAALHLLYAVHHHTNGIHGEVKKVRGACCTHAAITCIAHYNVVATKAALVLT